MHGGVFQLPGAEAGVTSQHCHVARPQAINRLLVGVEADEPSVLRHVHAVAELVVQRLVRPLQPVLEEIGHDNELGWAVGGFERVDDRAAAASTATDEREVDGVAPGGVNAGNRDAGESGGGDGLAAPFEKLAARGLLGIRRRLGCLFHVFVLLNLRTSFHDA